LPALRLKTIAALAAGLTLSACATALSTATGPKTGATPGSAATASNQPAHVAERDLTPDEKKAIITAVAPNLKDPDAARYHWVKFPTNASGDSVNYCATVDAKSPYPPYSGRQAYIVELDMSGNHITAAEMGLIAGGKDAALVTKMCAKYGLDPYKSE
jgi:hypothetical protein